MGQHNFMDKLSNAHLVTPGQVDLIPGTGYMRGWGTTTGNSLQGWGVGALFLNVSTGVLSKNSGTSTAATWVSLGAVDAANTWALLQTFTLGLTSAAPIIATAGGVI